MEEELNDIPANGSAAFTIKSWMDPTESPIKSLWEWHRPEDTPLNIVLCGAAGTGKRRLAKALARDLEITCIEGIARSVHKLGGDLNKKSSWEDEFMIFLAQMWEESEYPEWVSAGSMVDIVAYAHYYAEREGSRRSKQIVMALANNVRTISNNDYSVVFYLPLEGQPKADGVRSVDMAFQREIDRLIHHYLDCFGLDYFPLQGSHQQKQERALHYLSEFGLLSDRD
jgi:nicotinamide riboside kinase